MYPTSQMHMTLIQQPVAEELLAPLVCWGLSGTGIRSHIMGHLNQKTEYEECHHSSCTDVEFRALDTLSDSDRADAEIDRIIAETNMMESADCSTSVFLGKRSEGGGGTRLDLADNDPETLIMRMNLLESLQNKVSVNKEREDGEVSDEDVYSSRDVSVKVTPDSSFIPRKSSKHSARKSERLERRDDGKRDRRRAGVRSSTRTTETTRHYSTRRGYLYEVKSERSFRTRRPASRLRSHERRCRMSTSSRYSSTHRLGITSRDASKGKDEVLPHKQVPELSITLPVSPSGQNSSDILVTTLNQNGKSSPLERVVEASTSLGGSDNRLIKRVVDSGAHISVTVNTTSEEHEDVISSSKNVSERSCAVENVVPSRDLASAPRWGSSWLNRRGSTSDAAKGDARLFPQLQTPYHSATTLPCMEDLLVLPPPPAPPVLSKSADVVENYHPSSIRVEVREGGGRVAQLSATTKTKDIFTEEKRFDSKTSQHLVAHPPPPPLLAENPDNYDSVGMDVESSHSGNSSIVGVEESEALTLTRHRIFSESDETQLREMLLNQVILNRMRKAESRGQSSNASVCDISTSRITSAANNSASRNESGNIDLKSVTTQTDSPDDNEQFMESSDARSNAPVNTKRCSVESCDFSDTLRKVKKMDGSLEGEDISFFISPQPCSLSELEALLREKRSQLSELNMEISERMSYLDSSLRRRAELKSALNELEADIDARRTQCRILMQRRNVIRREVERCEERKLDQLLSNEWDFRGDTTKIIPSDEQGQQHEAQSAVTMSRSFSTECLLGIGCSFDRSEAWNEEQTMRLKLLAKMKTSDTPTSSSSQDMVNGETLCNTEELHDQFTQTATTIDEGDVVTELQPLYRSDNFPQRLRRFVGIPCDMSSITTPCPNELSGKKCTDVYCESKHTKDEELTTVDVLSMLITRVPGLVHLSETTDVTRQAVELKAKRIPNERFGVFARRLLDELPSDKRSMVNERNGQENMRDFSLGVPT